MPNSSLSSEKRIAARAAMLLLGVVAPVAAPGCASESVDPPEPASLSAQAEDGDVVVVSPADWPVAIRSTDPIMRAAAANAVPGAPGPDGAEVLRSLIENDDEATVREQAVIAVTQVLGRDAKPLLKQAALNDEARTVVAAAMASYHMLEQRHPEPARGWIQVTMPHGARTGEEIPVQVRFGSSDVVPRVKLFVGAPQGFEISQNGRRWDGSLEAGEEHTVELSLRATRDATPGRVEAQLVLSYDTIDYEELREVRDVDVRDERIVLEQKEGGQ